MRHTHLLFRLVMYNSVIQATNILRIVYLDALSTLAVVWGKRFMAV